MDEDQKIIVGNTVTSVTDQQKAHPRAGGEDCHVDW
jgi:hypothetical protein